MGPMAWGAGGGKIDPSAEVVRRGDAIEGRPVMMSVFFQPASMGADAGTRREMEERIRRTRALERVPRAEHRPVRRLARGDVTPARLLRAIRAVLTVPFAVSRQVAEG